MEDDQARAAARVEMVARLLYALLSVAWLMWILIPEHKRRLMLMRAAKMAERSAWRTASRAGRQAMALEISGRGMSYGLPYQLSRLAQRAGRAYEEARGA